MIRWFWMIGFLLAGASPVEAGPLQVVSESLSVEHTKKRIQFSGDVRLSRDDFELRCDRLVAFYKEHAGGELQQAEAYGNVSMQQGDKHGSSNEAVYKQSEGILILIGEAKVEDSEGTIQSDKIVHYIQTTEARLPQAAGEDSYSAIKPEGNESSSPDGEQLP